MKLRPLALVLGALVPLVAAAPAVAAPHWSSPVKVAPPSADPAAGAPPQAFVAPDGRSLAVSTDGLKPWLATGDVTGRFGSPVGLGSEAASTNSFDAALGADGTLAVAWVAGGTAHVTVVPPAGGPRPQVDLPGTNVNAVAVAVGGDGSVTVAQRGKPSSTSYVVSAASAPAGGGFGEPQTLDSGSGGMDQVDAAAGPGGAVAITYRKLSPRYHTYVAVRPAGVGAFEPTAKVGVGDVADNQPRVAFDADGTVVAAWANPTGALYAQRPPGPGVGFGAPAPLGPGGENVSTMDLVATPQGGTAATWLATGQIRAAVQGLGGGFGDAAGVVPAPSQIAPTPAIAVAPSGVATVVFPDPTDGSVYAADVGGAKQVIGYAPVERASSVAVAASADRTVALWRDADGGVSAATRSEAAPPSTGPGAKPPAPDKRRPKLTYVGGKRISVTRRARSFTIKMRCDEVCSIAGAGSLRIQRGKKRVVAPLRPFKSRKATKGTQKVTFVFGTSTRRDLTTAFKSRRSARAFLDITATDKAGNLTRKRLELVIREKRR